MNADVNSIYYPRLSAFISVSKVLFSGVFLEAAGAVVAAVDAADHCDSAGADQLDDAEWAHQVDEGFDLFFLAGDFDHYFVRGDVDDSAAEDRGQLADFGALARLHFDFDQHQ